MKNLFFVLGLFCIALGAQAQHQGGHYSSYTGSGSYDVYDPYNNANDGFYTARFCSARLQARNGATLQLFSGQGSTLFSACEDARWQCEDELSYRQSSGQNPFAMCIVDHVTGPRPLPGSYMVRCQSSLDDLRGMSHQVFEGQGYDRHEACSMARARCQREVRRRYRMGSRIQLQCNVRGVLGRPVDFVTRQCAVNLYNPRGRMLRQFNAQATGRRGSGVKQLACHKAQSQCERLRNPAQYCQRSGGVVVNPAPVPRPRPRPLPPGPHRPGPRRPGGHRI